ncbi:MAG: hypothetical protein Q9181_007266, partial [Wetmoreana brouardii]
VYTAFPGDYLPADYVPSGTVTLETRTGGSTTYPQPTAEVVITMNCTDFMTMPFASGADVTKFKQDPVCTSYLEWDEAHPKAPQGIGYDPPGNISIHLSCRQWRHVCPGPMRLGRKELHESTYPSRTWGPVNLIIQLVLQHSQWSDDWRFRPGPSEELLDIWCRRPFNYDASDS